MVPFIGVKQLEQVRILIIFFVILSVIYHSWYLEITQGRNETILFGTITNNSCLLETFIFDSY